MNNQKYKPFLTPFSLNCKNCGAPMNFDIIHQNYGCQYCGTTEFPETHHDLLNHWANQMNANLKKENEKTSHYQCPNCGAEVQTVNDSETINCSFCGSAMVTSSFAASDHYPVAIIPFQLTLEDAKKLVLDELEKSLKSLTKNEKNKIRSNIYQLREVYLPFQLYTGPIEAEIARTSQYNNRVFHLKSYVNQKAVIACNNIENSLVDQIEPFNMEQLHPFEFIYIGGHQAKTQDNKYIQLQEDYIKEINNDLKQALGNKLGSASLDIDVNVDNSFSIPVLLPVFFVRFKDISLSINGQTGKIGILNREKPKKNNKWLIEPSIITFIILCIVLYFYQDDISGGMIMTTVIGIIIFEAYHYNGSSFIYDNIIKSNKTYKRENRKLVETDNLDHATFKKPIFYEKLRNNSFEPVDIKFLPIRLIISLIFLFVAILFLPQIIYFMTLPLMMMHNQNIEILKLDSLLYSAVWYILVVAFTAIFGLTYGRQGLFDWPYIRAYGSKDRFVLAKGNVPLLTVLKKLFQMLSEWKWIYFSLIIALIVAIAGMYL